MMILEQEGVAVEEAAALTQHPCHFPSQRELSGESRSGCLQLAFEQSTQPWRLVQCLQRSRLSCWGNAQ